MTTGPSYLKHLDYSVVQQCMHCGLCLPTCPTYEATKVEGHSPRGRIALMRAIADESIETTKDFAKEMYFCLGCLACMTACPANVNYAELFEHARARSRSQRCAPLRTAQPHPEFHDLAGCFMDLARLTGWAGFCGCISDWDCRPFCAEVVCWGYSPTPP